MPITRPTPTPVLLSTADPRYAVRILPANGAGPSGKLADAELIFTPVAGTLAGMALWGFAIWERRSGTGRNVTFPARTYTVNGERRSFSLLRPQPDALAGVQDGVRDLILDAYARWDSGQTATPATATTAAPSIAAPPATVRAAQQQLDAL